MYVDYFHLSGLPFQLSPDHRFFFRSSVHERAIAHLKFGLNQGEGFIVITGDVGAGKTTVVAHLLSTLDQRRYIAANIVTTHLDQDDTLRMVCSAFGLGVEGRDKATLIRDIEHFLAVANREGRRCILFVDEAQNLSLKALEELRMLSNLQVEGRCPLQSFLLGQPQFRTLLGRPDLSQLRQRVIASYHLGPLNERETAEYILHRLKTVDWQNDPEIRDEAFGPIYRYTGGVPRQINTLCSRLLLYCFLEEAHVIDEAVVEEVASELAREIEGISEETGEAGAEAELEAERPDELLLDETYILREAETDEAPEPVATVKGGNRDKAKEEQRLLDALVEAERSSRSRVDWQHAAGPAIKNGTKTEKRAKPEAQGSPTPDDEDARERAYNRLMRRALLMVVDYLEGQHR